MFKTTFQIAISLLLCTRAIFAWDFAVTTSDRIRFYNGVGNWTEVDSAAHHFDKLSAITYDEAEDVIYFNDQQANDIYSLKIPLNKTKSITNEIARTLDEQVTALAYDPVDRTLFWTDNRNRKIYAFSIGLGEKPRVLFDFAGENVKPDGVAVDFCRRKLYWTNSNRDTASIEMSSLDGSDRKVLINTGLYYPHGIFVDQLSDRIFYVVDQPGLHFTVESAKLDGTDRQVVVRDTYHSPCSLTVTDDSVYWTDYTFKTIWRVAKNSTGDVGTRVVAFENDAPGIVSRMGMLQKLKFDNECSAAIEQIQTGLLVNRTDVNLKMRKEKQDNELYCLSKGLYSDVRQGCICDPGYSGSRCEIDACHNFCVHGACSLSKGSPNCTCQLGYKGERCELSKCRNFCMNGGHCTVNGTEPVCNCPVAFAGKQCETNLTSALQAKCDSYCMNGANCTIKHSEPVCECTGTFIGRQCERNTTEYCSPFCLLQRNHIEVVMPDYCYKVCSLSSEYQDILAAQRSAETCRSSWNKSIIVLVVGALVGLVLIYLIIQGIRHIYKPAVPKIKKTYVVRKNTSQTPLTHRPVTTEQCEITIENCCNMSICETPCFDPKLLQKNMTIESTKEDKDLLIPNMETDY